MLAAPPAAAQDWPVRQPVAVRLTGRFKDPRLNESSGVVRGRTNPSVLWTLNDSGNPPFLFAVDTTGTTRAVLRVAGVANTDWEALSAGPCGTEWCLWIGDIGDNRAVRRSIAIYRVVEPTLGTAVGDRTVQPIDSLVARYPDGPHDAEALVVTGTGAAAIITKGRDGWIGEYRIPTPPWGPKPALLEPAGRLPIPTGFLLGHLVTDAALSPNGQILAVRTYRAVYLFDRRPGTTGLPDRPRTSCSIAGLEPQGEGIAWWNDETLVMTSERGLSRAAAPITVLQCPLR